MFVTTSPSESKPVMLDEPVFNKQLWGGKHANKTHYYFIEDDKCWGLGQVKGWRQAAGYLQGFIPYCAKKTTIPNCSYSLPRSLSAVQSLEGMSANLIPGSIQLKRVQRHMAQGRVIWLESCVQRRSCFDSFPLFSVHSQRWALEMKQLSQERFPQVGYTVLRGL